MSGIGEHHDKAPLVVDAGDAGDGQGRFYSEEDEAVDSSRSGDGRGSSYEGNNTSSSSSSSNPSNNDSFDVDAVFKQLPTVFWASLAIVGNLVMILLVFLLPMFCDKHQRPPGGDADSDADEFSPVDQCKVSSFSILVYSHCTHWLIHLIVDQRLKWHHKKSRVRGYVQFYIQTVSS